MDTILSSCIKNTNSEFSSGCSLSQGNQMHYTFHIMYYYYLICFYINYYLFYIFYYYSFKLSVSCIYHNSSLPLYSILLLSLQICIIVKIRERSHSSTRTRLGFRILLNFFLFRLLYSLGTVKTFGELVYTITNDNMIYLNKSADVTSIKKMYTVYQGLKYCVPRKSKCVTGMKNVCPKFYNVFLVLQKN